MQITRRMTMRTIFHALSASGLLWAALAAANAPSPNKKLTICHVPADENTKLQTISVGEAALGAHLAHGDGVGACPTGCQSDLSCDDGNPCTSDQCDTQGGCNHVTVSCDDGNPCTVELCDPSVGCKYAPADGAACDDGNACSANDACFAGACQGSAVAGCCAASTDCDDGNACTTDSCANGGCSNTPLNCNVADACLVGYCDPVSGQCATSPVSCDDSNACTDDSCDSSAGCVHQSTATPQQYFETTCSDFVDNDCDGFIDAADPDCAVPPDPGMD
jgi:Dictyostelium (slime mold) repeat